MAAFVSSMSLGAILAFVLELLDRYIAELDRVVVAGESEVAFLKILSGVGLLAHELGDLAYVAVQDNAAVELDLDGRANYRYSFFSRSKKKRDGRASLCLLKAYAFQSHTS